MIGLIHHQNDPIPYWTFDVERWALDVKNSFAGSKTSEHASSMAKQPFTIRCYNFVEISMNKWKSYFFVILLLYIFTVALQQFNIATLKWENNDLKHRIEQIEKDATLIGKVFLSNNEKVFIIDKLKQEDPSLEVFEYDLGSVKLRGLEMYFDKNGKLRSINSKIY